MSLLQNVEAVAAKVKAGFLKVVSEIDGVVVPESEVVEPIVAQLLNAVLPGSGRIADIAEAGLVALAKVLDAGGAAAEANLVNAGLDTALIADVKALIPTLKAATKAAPSS